MIVIDETKQVEALVKFKRPLSCHEIIDLVGSAIVVCNKIFKERWKSIPFPKRIFKFCDVYRFDYDTSRYCSYDGKAPMRRVGSHLLNPESYPDAKYETRYLLGIIGLRDVRLYFNVIPGVAKEGQFGTLISDQETVSCITIKANMSSSLRWKREQAKFLELLVPIIEKMTQEMKWGHQFGDLFF